MRAPAIIVSLCIVAFLAPAVVAAELSPYAGQELREIKSLSPQDMDDLRAGHGIGLAKAAELNGYPGPAHVLDLASELKLSPEQIHRMQDIRDRMSAAAKQMGMEIIRRERELENQFESGTIAESRLMSETEAIGNLQGHLRAVHIRAHIEAKGVLTTEQVARYNVLRGYTSASNDDMRSGTLGR
jgi:Spy/CpxP family protein refolding chaperone